MSSVGQNPEQMWRLAQAADGKALAQLLELYRNYLTLLDRLQINRPLQVKVDASHFGLGDYHRIRHSAHLPQNRIDKSDNESENDSDNMSGKEGGHGMNVRRGRQARRI